MNFARKQLEKYGWSDGKGLGKNENGISEAIKPKLKRSVTGIGHDAAADFTEHWWTQLYNKAASNVEVEEKNGKTKKIKTKDTDEFEITNSTWKIKKKKKSTDPEEKYTDFFVKKTILTNDGQKIKVAASESDDDDDDDEKETKDVFKMTDEELFAACEGRTAHKGARHGLRATGKLARIAQQEQMLLTQPQYSSYSHAKKLKEENKKLSVSDLQVVEDMSLNSDGDISSIKKKKKNKKKRCTSPSYLNENNLELNVTEPLPKRKKRKDESVATETNDVASKKSKLVEEEIESMDNETSVVENIETKKKKKKNKCNILESEEIESNIVDKDEDSVKKTKKEKVKKC